jgi:Haem-binding domain
MTTRTRMPLILGLIFMALLLLALVGTTAISFPLWLRYRNATGLGAARTVAQIAAGLAAAGFFVAAGIVAIATALQPASRWRKLLYILPAYLLIFTLAGVLLYLLGIGTVGAFTTIWIAAGGLLGMIAVVIAAARMRLSAQTAKRAITTLGITGALSALAWLAMGASLTIVLTSQPSAATGGQNGLPGASGAQAVPTAAAGEPATGQAQQEREPGGGRQSSTTPLLIGVALITVFGMIAWTSIARGWRAASEPSDPAQAAARVDYRHEAGRAAFSGIAITIVGLAVAQLVPIAHDNPPVQTAVQWDSPQTQKLAQRACMDCHSNETTWPWYAYVAPGSWLLRNHVSEGRAQLNLSELNNVQPFRAARLPEDAAQQIRNGAMPPADYLILHSEARLSDAEKQQLMQGMQQSLANSLTK